MPADIIRGMKDASFLKITSLCFLGMVVGVGMVISFGRPVFEAFGAKLAIVFATAAVGGVFAIATGNVPAPDPASSTRPFPFLLIFKFVGAMVLQVVIALGVVFFVAAAAQRG